MNNQIKSKVMRLDRFLILWVIATIAVSGCIERMSTSNTTDLTPEDINNLYKINGKLLNSAETKEFFDKFYENSKTFPQEFIIEWIDGFGLNLEKNTIDEMRKNVNEKTTSVFMVNNAYTIYSLKNTTWVYFVVGSNMDPIDRYVKEYTIKEKGRIKKWYMLTSSDELVEKSEIRKIIEDFYKVQKQMLSENIKIKREKYYPQPFSDIINEFDPVFVKNTSYNGSLTEENAIIVHTHDAGLYKDDISYPSESMFFIYRLKGNDAFINRRPIIVDEKTMRIIYADFGGPGYIYEKIDYLAN